jgi:hypothetical protein
MAKIVSYGSLSPDPSDQPQPVIGRKEVTVTPQPKTRKQARANKKAERLAQAQERQAQNSYAPLKKTGRAKRALRRLKREAYQKARDADSRT